MSTGAGAGGEYHGYALGQRSEDVDDAARDVADTEGGGGSDTVSFQPRLCRRLSFNAIDSPLA
jgi:hypothetical protein